MTVVILPLSLSSCSWFESKPDQPAPAIPLGQIEKPVIKKSDQQRSELYTELGENYLRFGRLDLALENLEKALDLNDDNAKAHNAIAALYEKIEDYDKAKDHYQEAISLEPEMAGPYNNYGRLLCQTGNYTEGLELLKKSIALPLNSRPWYGLTNIGKCELTQGKKIEAEGYFMQAIQVRPSFAPALMEMLKIKFEQQEYLSSRAFLERYLNYERHTPKTLWMGIQIEQALGSEDKADEYRNQLIHKFPASEEALEIRKQTL